MNKKYDTPRPYLPADIERFVKVEAGHKCTVHHCNEHTYLEIHHIDENRENNTVENLILLCDKHHKMAHAKQIDRKALRKYKDSLIENGLNLGEVNNYDAFYRHIIDFISKELFLSYWKNTSDNLIANSITDDVLEGFHNVATRVIKTDFPSQIIDLDNSIKELGLHLRNITEHFYNSEHAFLDDRQQFWSRDMRWKKVWLEHEEYERKYKLVDDWREQLFILHKNIVVALNRYATQVRLHIEPEYFMREQFSLIDSLGTYNMMQPYELIPSEYTELN